MSAAGTPTATLEVRGVLKRYGTFVACRDVSFVVQPGEVVGLLGQNGAGKSTVMKVVCGIESYERGRVSYGGETIGSADFARARDLGVAMVHQEFSLIGPLSVWENVALSIGGPLRRRTTIERVRRVSNEFGLGLDDVVEARVDTLSVAMRQRIEIAKCLVTEPRLILLDEPTAILSREEARHLFQIVRRLVQESNAAVLVSNHRLDEILDVTDRVVVLRSGRVTGELATSEATEAILAREMLGDDFATYVEASSLLGLGETGGGERQSLTQPPAHPAGAPTAAQVAGVRSPIRSEGGDLEALGPALRLQNVTLERSNGAPALSQLTLTVARGEIVGIVGVEGNGQVEMVDVLAGRTRPTSGTVAIAPPLTAGQGSRRHPAGVVPSDRHRHGCVLGMSVAENLFLGRVDAATRRRLIRKGRLRQQAAQLIAEFGIRCDGPEAPMWTLSGGHQQRVVLARELQRRPSLLVVDQPTRGLDVAAVEAVWSRIREAAARGIGVLVVSSDLVEILHLCSRILVMSRGNVTGELSPDAVDVERLGLLIGGVTAESSA